MTRMTTDNISHERKLLDWQPLFRVVMRNVTLLNLAFWKSLTSKLNKEPQVVGLAASVIEINTFWFKPLMHFISAVHLRLMGYTSHLPWLFIKFQVFLFLGMISAIEITRQIMISLFFILCRDRFNIFPDIKKKEEVYVGIFFKIVSGFSLWDRRVLSEGHPVWTGTLEKLPGRFWKRALCCSLRQSSFARRSVSCSL